MDLIIGDKNLSSWSMRPWLVLEHAGIAFNEVPVRLRQTSSSAEITAAGSPSGLVPALRDGDVVIVDSLAICEYAAELAPQATLWPADRAARALGRSAAAEMHAGFHSLRGECSMDIVLRTRADVVEATAADLRRLVTLWRGLLERFGGPFLLGDWSIADAFYTPVATRIRTYGLRLSDFGDIGPCGAYAERLLETPAFRKWEAGAIAEVAGR